MRGSSTVTSYRSVFRSGRENRSTRCSASVCGKPAAREPESLVVADRIDDQRVLLPAADRVAVVGEHDLGRLPLRPPVGVDHAPVAVAAAHQHEDASDLALLDELHAIRHLELARTAGRHAARDRIVLEQRALPMQVHRLRPRLHWRDAIGVGEIQQQAIVVHTHRRIRGLDQGLRAGVAPVPLLARGWAQTHVSIRPAWRGRRPARRRSCGGRLEEALAGCFVDDRPRQGLPASDLARERLRP